MQAVASPEPARVTVWATGMVQEAPQAAAPEPDRVTAGAAVPTLRVVSPFFGHEEDSADVYFQCEHGWSLISGGPDDTLQPVCPSEECREEGENWLKIEGLIAVVSGAQRVVDPLCTMSVPEPARAMVRAKGQGDQVEGSDAVVPMKGRPGTSEGPAGQTQQVGGARDPASLQHNSVEGSEAAAPTEGLSSTPEGPARQAQQVGGARDPARPHASLQYSSRSHQGLHWDNNREAGVQPTPLRKVAVPEPARVMVRATRHKQQAQHEAWLRFGATVYSMKRSQARARLADKYWRMKQVASKITREVPMQRQWAPAAEASGHEGLNAEEFRRQCSMWCLEEGKEGPCRMTGTCGEQARVMLWQGPAVVGTDRLASRVVLSKKQKQNEAQLG